MGYSKPKGIKYRCWFAVKGLEPPEECKCSTSKYGKVVYIKPDYDPRLFPPLPRNSVIFKTKFKNRTSVERSKKRMFEDYAIEEYRSQSAMLRMSLATFAVANIHLDAWVKHSNFSFSALMKKQAA